MAQKAATTIEEKIRRDGSLSEERKTELLRLVSTMKPEMTRSLKSQQDTPGTIRSTGQSMDETIGQETKHKDS